MSDTTTVRVLVEREPGYPRYDVTHAPGTYLEIPRYALADFLADGWGVEVPLETAEPAPAPLVMPEVHDGAQNDAQAVADGAEPRDHAGSAPEPVAGQDGAPTLPRKRRGS